MPNYKTNPGLKPSELFLNSLQGGGSHHVNCGFCGRQHYCPDSSSLYDDDVEEYNRQAREEHAADPDGVILHLDDDYALTKDINGMAIVIDCPCNGLAIYENFIWTDRNSIRRYLGNRVNEEFELCKQEMTLNKLSDIDGDVVSSTKEIWESKNYA